MTSLDDMWAAIERSPPEDVQTLAVAADRARDEDLDALAFALQWCAGRLIRPYRRPDIKRYPWTWLRSQSRYGGLTRTEIESRRASTLPEVVFDAIAVNAAGSARPYQHEFTSARAAYEYLARGLGVIRDAVAAPDVVLPDPSVLSPDVVCCDRCGVLWSRTANRAGACRVCYLTDRPR